MSTTDKSAVQSDMEHVVRLIASGQRDPAFEQRVHDEAERIRAEVFRKHGMLDIGVAAIRDLREGS